MIWFKTSSLQNREFRNPGHMFQKEEPSEFPSQIRISENVQTD